MRRLKVYIITGVLLMILTLSGCEFKDEAAVYMNDTAVDLAIHNLFQAVPEEIEKIVEKIGTDETKHSTVEEKQYSGSSSTPQELVEYIRLNMPELPKYNGQIYEVVNENEPFFTDKDFTTVSFEYYSNMDEKGRCQTCVANIGYDLMPTEERGSIGNVKPSGWVQNKYPGLVEGNYLYNRCHLIGYQLTGENANEKNLITGTRAINTEGMLPFENMVADYIKETKNHVLYRVTPVFEGDNLLATGVLMEAKSVEDNGDGITYCVFVFNIQNGIRIDYTDGSNQLDKHN